MLVQLTGLAMQRLLKSTALEQSPGGDISIDIRDSDIDAASEKSMPSHLSSADVRKLMQPLKNDLAAQKRDERFRARFRLPITQQLLMNVAAVQVVETPALNQEGEVNTTLYHGRLCLSDAFLTFNATERGVYFDSILPLYTIRRVERINDNTNAFSIKIVNWHQHQILFRLNV